MKPLSPYHFFLKHAGSSYSPKTETVQQGAIRGARALAKAERLARQRGYRFHWSIDPGSSSADWIDDNEDGGRNRDPWRVWQCCAMGSRDPGYRGAGEVLANLSGIDFGRGGTPRTNPYRRVVEAELAQEALDREGGTS